jgi:hypothetical protein
MARLFPLLVMARLVRATRRGTILEQVARTIPRTSRGRAMTRSRGPRVSCLAGGSAPPPKGMPLRLYPGSNRTRVSDPGETASPNPSVPEPVSS